MYQNISSVASQIFFILLLLLSEATLFQELVKWFYIDIKILSMCLYAFSKNFNKILYNVIVILIKSLTSSKCNSHVFNQHLKLIFRINWAFLPSTTFIRNYKAIHHTTSPNTAHHVAKIFPFSGRHNRVQN